MKKIIRVLIHLSVIRYSRVHGFHSVLNYDRRLNWFIFSMGNRSFCLPPDSENLIYRRIELQGEDGIKLTGWVVLSEKDTTSSPWILFCHGNASDISYIDYIERYKLFTSLGLNVLTFDYRGFGESRGD